MVLIYLITFVTMIVCNIQLQNKKDPFIIMYTAILMEIIFWIKAKISRFREKQK